MDESIMQHENERTRVVVEGRLADGGSLCTLVAVRYRSPQYWILYPHGVGKLGVVLSEEDAAILAQAIAPNGR